MNNKKVILDEINKLTFDLNKSFDELRSFKKIFQKKKKLTYKQAKFRLRYFEKVCVNRFYYKI